MSTDRKALIVVDVQVDFCEGGALPVEGGNAVAGRIAAYLGTHAGNYALIVASRDFHLPHSDNDGHFAHVGVAPDYITTWPVHCVQATPGDTYHPDLAGVDDWIDVHIVKGMGQAGYSAFDGYEHLDRTTFGTSLAEVLKREQITAIDVVGLATDHCVRATALAASVDHHYPTTVITNLCAGVAPTTTSEALEELQRVGISLVAN